MPSSAGGYRRVMSGITRTNGACPTTVPRATIRTSPSRRRAGVRSGVLALTPVSELSVMERQRHAPSVTRRQVARDQDLERSETLPAVGLRLGLPTQGLDHVLVVQRVPEAVNRGGLVARGGDVLIPRTAVRKLPVLDLGDRDAADSHGALFAKNGDRALEILRVSEHGNVDRAECP